MRVRWRAEWPHWLALAAMGLLAGWSWPTVPGRIPVHWDAAGRVDAYGGKAEGLLALPLTALRVYLLLLFVPRVDPGRANYTQFAGAYAAIRLAATVFLAAVYGAMVAQAHGRRLDVGLLTVVLIGVLLVVVGSVLGKVRPAWFVGIRTPWTLSSKRAWTRTNRLGGWLFILCGVAYVGVGLGAPSIEAALPPLLAGFGVAVVGLVVYSYLVWRSDPDKVPPAGTRAAEGG